MSALQALAPAKVNLFLHVGPVKPNGRHDLDSLVVFAGAEAADRLSAEPDETLTLSISGAGDMGHPEDNLVLRAARALQAAAGVQLGARLHLDKCLPVAAGIGGGSADAGAALRLLTKLWSLEKAPAEAAAPSLGGDVPAAFYAAPCLMRGEGEQITALSLPASLPAVLVNPGIACPTGPVFKAFDDAGGGAGFTHTAMPTFPSGDDGRTALVNWLSVQANDLESVAINAVPEIGRVLTALETTDGINLARMSGSGATCFGLYETQDEAEAAAETLRATRPDWWSVATLLGTGAA